jgi:N-methylhydantoinase A
MADAIALLGVDTGGTFTDFVLYEGAGLRVHKVLSTPDAPERAILQGIGELGLDPARLRVVHGSTVATNAALEGKGVRTAFITNRGLRDLLTLGRQARRALYDLQPPPLPPPVPEELCLETGGRLGADGSLIEPLTASDLAELRARLTALAPRAVAINLLFSFLDDAAERAIAGVVPEGIFISRSSEVLPEYREYERGIATWLNAWVGPLVAGYLERLAHGLGGGALYVMQSSGATIASAQAARKAVHMLLSGPAGGLAGARFVGRVAGCERLLTFDMGGTSTDVALVDGEPRLTTEGAIGPYPVAVPMVDMHTIGAGGGSIARVDAGGLLQVGPQSAGADPGPACYGRGGREATVTDAHLVLGRLRPEAFLGGAMALDAAAARAALAPLAERLGLALEAAAEGIVRVADEHMARALRVISVQRGVDPRGCTLLSFGGAGGLHVCALAEALAMTHALVPVHAGVLSALGMLAAPRGRQLSRTLGGLLEAHTDAALAAQLDELAARGTAELVQEGVARAEVVASRSLDLRYRGQSYTLNVAWQGAESAAARFHAAHEARYGHRLDVPVELVNVRVGLTAAPPPLRLEPLARGSASGPAGVARVHGISGEVALWQRGALVPGQAIAGPALVTEAVSTTWLAPGWRCRVDPLGNLLLERSEKL